MAMCCSRSLSVLAHLALSPTLLMPLVDTMQGDAYRVVAGLLASYEASTTLCHHSPPLHNEQTWTTKPNTTQCGASEQKAPRLKTQKPAKAGFTREMYGGECVATHRDTFDNAFALAPVALVSTFSCFTYLRRPLARGFGDFIPRPSKGRQKLRAIPWIPTTRYWDVVLAHENE